MLLSEHFLLINKSYIYQKSKNIFSNPILEFVIKITEYYNIHVNKILVKYSFCKCKIKLENFKNVRRTSKKREYPPPPQCET